MDGCLQHPQGLTGSYEASPADEEWGWRVPLPSAWPGAGTPTRIKSKSALEKCYQDPFPFHYLGFVKAVWRPRQEEAMLKRLEECKEIDASQKEALAACLAKAEEQSVFKKLLSKVKDAHTQDNDTRDARPLDTQTLLSFLKLFQGVNPELRVALLERKLGSREAPQQGGRKLGATSGKVNGQPYRKTLEHSRGRDADRLLAVLQGGADAERGTAEPHHRDLKAAEEGFLTASEERVKKSEIRKLCGQDEVCVSSVVYQCLQTLMIKPSRFRAQTDTEDPCDCKECQMSFATLQEHPKHVHEAHSREYHP
ncbi:hypothetical protein DUI87_31973 [Hirundo rustica rustica]|uniref:C2H2-type domain-containing protein n=1 Tax=Hirundo rustica rustica TaxID=333673 RepID=A0A3M0IYE1_HIRRU|nr:hypothetical protein DUI87_31973 [Hirundo rustica rustica]